MKAKMDRLTLLRRPKTAEKEKCLPAGDGLPSWSSLPLDSKFPMVPNPKGSVVFCTTKLCDSKHKSSRNFDFDLSDPYCHLISSEYHPLHDRHLRNHFNLPQMRRHLLKKGFVTSAGKVICTLKEFNRYRQYLRKICLNELNGGDTDSGRVRRGLGSMFDSANNEESPTDARINIVRDRLAEQRETTRKRIENILQQKSNRLQKRLDEMQAENVKRDIKRQEEERKRQHSLIQHHEQIRKKNRQILRRWKLRERQHRKRVEDKRRHRLLEQQKQSAGAWETRKQVQRERMETEAKFIQEEQYRREESIANRDVLFKEHRDKINAKLEQLKEKARKEKEEREEKYARRLAHRLALADIRAWSKRRGRRRSRRARFISMWNLEETFRRFRVPDSGRKSSSKFLHMLNDAMDDVLLFVTDEDEVFEDTNKDEILREQAKFIVDSVMDRVKNDIWPQYVIENHLEDYVMSDAKRKSVQFGEEEIILTSHRPSVNGENLRNVNEHILTPVASPFGMSEIPTEYDEADADNKLVEKLLTRLLNDLNERNLSKEDLVKLTSLSMQIINDMQSKDRDDIKGFENGNLYETVAADDLVKFTLSKILDEIKSGEISQSELTELTFSLLDTEKSDETSSSPNDEDVEMFIEGTIQKILSDKSLERDSPVYDYMLDDFIVKTLAEISDDLENGRLPNDMISKMLSMISEEIGSSSETQNSETKLKDLLEKILQDLASEGSDTLYKVVHVIVTSYHDFKDTSTQSLSELITTIVEKISGHVSSGEIKESEIDFDALCDVAIRVSSASFSSIQLHRIASELVFALSLDHQGSIQNAAFSMENVVEDAKAKLCVVDVEKLKFLASAVTSSCHEAIGAVGTEEELKAEKNHEPFLEDVSRFVVDILKLVWNGIDKGQFSEQDIQEMTQMCDNIGRGSSQLEGLRKETKNVLSRAVKGILSDVANNRIEETEMNEIGKHLIECGKKILGSSASSSTSSSTSSSLVSTAVAEDVVSHVLTSIQAGALNDTLSKESIKELAMCIFKSRTHQDYPGNPMKTSSQSSKMAEEIVLATINDIMNDLNGGYVRPETLSSIAISAVSLLSADIGEVDKERMNSTMIQISDCLRRDSIDRSEAKKIFLTILDSYEGNWKELFTSSGKPLSSDSALAESIIRDTLSKIGRDLASGVLVEDDLVSLMDGYEDRRRPKEISDDIVNLSLAIIQEMLADINTGTVTDEMVMNFIAMLDMNPTYSEGRTIEKLKQKLRRIGMDIIRHRSESSYVQQIFRTFGSKDSSSLEGSVGILQQVLHIVKDDVLTRFIRVTLQTVLTDMQSGAKDDGQYRFKTIADFETDAIVQSTSSVIANDVVRNLLQKIEYALMHGSSLASNEILPNFNRDCVDPPIKRTGALSAYSSKELGNIILETLNNVVSNLRLEKDISAQGQWLCNDNIKGPVASNLVQDFVLEKLQGIVESMQDQLSFGEDYHVDVVPVEEDLLKKGSSLLSMDENHAQAFITAVLKDVVSEISGDFGSQQGELLDKQTSTLSLEAEAVVIGTLQDILTAFTESSIAERQQKELEDTKQKVLGVLGDIKKDVTNEESSTIKTAITSIVKSVHSMGISGKRSENLVGNVIDSIITHVETDKIPIADVMDRSCSATSDILLSVSKGNSSEQFVDEEMEDEMEETDRPALSLQKMIGMTTRMLMVHEEIKGGSNIVLSERCKSDVLSSSISDIVKGTIDHTIDNIKQGKLSDEEIITLANALSQTRIEQEISQRLSNTSVDASIEDFIIGVLESVKNDIETEGLDSQSIVNITDRLADLGKKKSGATCPSNTMSCTSISSVTSEVIGGMVKDVLSKIASVVKTDSEINSQINSLSENDTVSRDDNTSAQFSKSTHSASESGSISRKNVNPNAVSMQSLSSSFSEESNDSPNKSIPKRGTYSKKRDQVNYVFCCDQRFKTKGTAVSKKSEPTPRQHTIKTEDLAKPLQGEETQCPRKLKKQTLQKTENNSSIHSSPVVIYANPLQVLRNPPKLSQSTPGDTRVKHNKNNKKIKKSRSSEMPGKIKQSVEKDKIFKKKILNEDKVPSESYSSKTNKSGKRSPSKEKKTGIITKAPSSPQVAATKSSRLSPSRPPSPQQPRKAVIVPSETPFCVQTTVKSGKRSPCLAASPTAARKTVVIPMELSSICGSHKTKVNIRKSTDELDN